MKYYIALFILSFSVSVKAQTDKIVFEYDTAGNQVRRYLCINCPSSTGKTISTERIEKLEEDDLQKFYKEDVISYYPNPVKEELFIKWELLNDNVVSSIQIFNVNGQVLYTAANLQKTNSKTFEFNHYPSGIYLIVLNYNNNEQKTIKIVKQ